MEHGANDFIKAQKRKKKIKKAMIFLTFFLLLLFLFLAKAPIFNIRSVEYKNNKIVTEDELFKLYEPVGSNLIFLNYKKAQSSLKKNPYISSVSLKKIYPNKLVIDIKENNAVYYIKNKSTYYILSGDLTVLELRDNINSLNLIKLENMSDNEAGVCQKITNNKSILNAANKISELLSRNLSNINFDRIDISNNSKIILYYKNVKVLVGNTDDLETKVNMAINVLQDSKVNLKKGSINVESKDRVIVQDDNNPAKETKDEEDEINTQNNSNSSEEFGD